MNIKRLSILAALMTPGFSVAEVVNIESVRTTITQNVQFESEMDYRVILEIASPIDCEGTNYSTIYFGRDRMTSPDRFLLSSPTTESMGLLYSLLGNQIDVSVHSENTTLGMCQVTVNNGVKDTSDLPTTPILNEGIAVSVSTVDYETRGSWAPYKRRAILSINETVDCNGTNTNTLILSEETPSKWSPTFGTAGMKDKLVMAYKEDFVAVTLGEINDDYPEATGCELLDVRTLTEAEYPTGSGNGSTSSSKILPIVIPVDLDPQP